MVICIILRCRQQRYVIRFAAAMVGRIEVFTCFEKRGKNGKVSTFLSVVLKFK